eukprot:s5481_g2.t1
MLCAPTGPAFVCSSCSQPGGVNRFSTQDAGDRSPAFINGNGQDAESPEDSDVQGEPETEVEDLDALLVDVQDHIFGEMQLPPDVAEELQAAFSAFLESAGSRDAAGEAVYAAIFDAAPELQALFKTPRSVMAMRFINGLTLLVGELTDPPALKTVTETLGFQHLDIEVTTARAGIFRNAILELFEQELGGNFTGKARAGLQALMNYVGGAMIYVRREYSERFNTLRVSWIAASNARVTDEDEQLARPEGAGDEAEDAAESQPGEQQVAARATDQANAKEHKAEDADKKPVSKGMAGTKVPENFHEMFTFNAAVMGFSNSLAWMNPVLDQFEAMVMNAANSYRLQEECDVLSLVLVKYKETIIYSEFKAVMLASLRSLVPKIWGVEHEVAWTWFWDNTERMIKRQTANIKGYQRAADRFIRHLTDDVVTQMRKDVYKVFFGQAPKGQDYFKQSSTRLNFIADKVLEMSLEMYKRPRRMVEEISALGLRHVGYGIPTELFAPFIEAWSQVLQMMLVEEKAASSVRWSLTLISKILVRTILEGSTIVMKAINTNSAKRFRKAIAISGRSQRAMEMLRITVGTQSISPLDWAIKSGSFQVARAMIDDLLTIRGDRDNYYYGALEQELRPVEISMGYVILCCDALFDRHPDILNILSATRGQGLLPALLSGLLWRSKVTEHKTSLFNAKQISVIIKTGDPKLMRHPVVSFVFNMLWSRLASIEFLKSRVLFMIQVVIFVLAQSILPRVAPKRETEVLRILLFSCRCSIYLFDMLFLLCAHIKYIVNDIRDRSFIFVLGIPCPAYLKDLASAVQLAMVIDLVFMCAQEPIFHCLGNMHGIYDGAGLFSTHCPEAQGQTTVYSVFSQIGVLLHWLLLVDCCIFSLRLSSYFLTCFYVLAELLYFLSAWSFYQNHELGSPGAILFLVLMFACSIAALDTLQGDFRSIPAGLAAQPWKSGEPAESRSSNPENQTQTDLAEWLVYTESAWLTIDPWLLGLPSNTADAKRA